MGIAFVPIYIRYLGVEAWGLVGFMAMLQAWLTLLDMGLTPSLTREMARYQAGAHSIQGIRDLLWSLQVIYGGIAIGVVFLVWFAAPWLAQHWLSAEHLPIVTITDAVKVVGIVLAMRMLEQVYRGAIQGLQHMVWLNGIQAVLATLRWAGAAAVLIWLETSISAFFLWQGLVSVISVLILARQANRYLPKASRPARFDWEAIIAIRNFAGGIAATFVLSRVLVQFDKLLLSTFLSLHMFGVYMLAVTVADALYILVTPVTTAASPKLTELVTRTDQSAIIGTYHHMSQLVALLLVPPAVVMVVFAESLLWVWTGDLALAREAAPLLSLLALGTLCNGFVQMPTLAQHAHGWTSLGVRLNSIAFVLLVPTLFWAVPRFGAIAGAWIWLAFALARLIVSVHFMHHRILQEEQWHWYRRAVISPLTVSFVVVITMSHTAPALSDRGATALFVCVAGAMAFLATLVTTPAPAAFMRSRFSRMKKRSSDD
jgi:O-antigen/teichoic acid export membrane protein